MVDQSAVTDIAREDGVFQRAEDQVGGTPVGEGIAEGRRPMHVLSGGVAGGVCATHSPFGAGVVKSR